MFSYLPSFVYIVLMKVDVNFICKIFEYEAQTGEFRINYATKYKNTYIYIDCFRIYVYIYIHIYPYRPYDRECGFHL